MKTKAPKHTSDTVAGSGAGAMDVAEMANNGISVPSVKLVLQSSTLVTADEVMKLQFAVTLESASDWKIKIA